jgi:anti-anti-sigma factor
MELTSRVVEDVVLVQVKGRIDFVNSKEFEDGLMEAIADIPQGKGKALLDLGGVSYMSSSGLRVLMLACKFFESKKSVIVVASLQPMLRDVFKISRFDKIFQVYETVKEAFEALSPEAASAYGDE